MTRPVPVNMPASVRRRLLNLAHERRVDFQDILNRYALERLLYRLSRSSHGDEFVLKGAMLFSLWSDDPHRATRDLDLLGRGDSTIPRLESVFKDICLAPVPDDGIHFDPASVVGRRIREDRPYQGVRLTLRASLEQARLSLQVDVGFGDDIIPPPEKVEFPVLLDFPKPRLRAYSRETVVAEKFHAMVELGMANSRMKDFYDIWILARGFPTDEDRLRRAILATFARRKTPLPLEPPLALTTAFSDDAAKRTQWRAFLRKNHLSRAPEDLSQVTEAIRAFIVPILESAV